MNKQAAAMFIMALNEMRQFVPPYLFDRLVANPVSAMIQDMANPKDDAAKPEQPGQSPE